MKSGFVSELTAIKQPNQSCGFSIILWQESKTDDVFWSFNCDFPGNDFQKLQGKGEMCGGFCRSNPRCSHFIWTNFEVNNLNSDIDLGLVCKKIVNILGRNVLFEIWRSFERSRTS